MTDITFVTSNQAKLAHARYLCRNYNVNILHYKQLFYGVGYDEPRVDDRTQLLTESFKDAVRRWTEHFSGDTEKLFFIEDTSVRIDALSDEENEIPGVNVKYWMQDITFAKLDHDLKERGNNRRCSVTSHVLLFLTKDLKNRIGIQDDYLVFKSSAIGSVAEKEYVFDTNMLYPWLDNRTFNKWFVPEGRSVPVSMLDVSEVGDFRKGAFEEMLFFLERNGIVKNKFYADNQLYFRFNDSFIICGRTCAGKSTIGRYLVDNYGYYHIEASDFMTHKLLETHGIKSGIDKHLFAAKVLSVEPLFVVNQLVEYMREHGIYDKFVITGFRTENEIQAFLRIFQKDHIHMVFVESCPDERFQRWKLRRRDSEDYSETRFHEIDNLQDEMGVGKIVNMPGMVVFNNHTNGLLLYYNEFCNKFLMNIDSIPDPLCEIKKKFANMRISLERVILITLALEYQKDDSKLFTTTEISHLINRNFSGFIRSKNNVSRYFNQSFNVFYDVCFLDDRNRYRLSPIGYSEAMMTIRNINAYIERDIDVKENDGSNVDSLFIDFVL